MTTRLFLGILMITAINLNLGAQNFSGMATYKTSASIQISIDSTQVPAAQIKKIQNMEWLGYI